MGPPAAGYLCGSCCNGGAAMSAPKPPCVPACPRRSPTCHNREFCKEWGVFQDALAHHKAIAAAARREEDDYEKARKGHVHDDVLKGRRR